MGKKGFCAEIVQEYSSIKGHAWGGRDFLREVVKGLMVIILEFCVGWCSRVGEGERSWVLVEEFCIALKIVAWTSFKEMNG